MDEPRRHSATPRFGKLNLCNYVPPTVHTASSAPPPSACSPSDSPPSLITHPKLPLSATSQSPPDEDSTSPTSSNLSTPSGSPMITPRVIVGGQPATYVGSLSEDDDAVAPSRTSHVSDWDWSALSKSQLERLARQRADPVPVAGALSPPAKAPPSNSTYDAFVTQWCFAQGPSLDHHGYGDGGIMA